MELTTVIHARLIDGKYHFGISSLKDPADDQDSLVFHIIGSGGVGPRTAPNPATSDEMDEWVARLREAGYKVEQQPRGR